MSILVHIALLGWIPAVILIFAVLSPRRAVIVSFLAAWLFLPVTGYAIAGLPDYTKMSATCVGVLLATLIFDSGRFLSFRPHWIDLPMVVWCGVPLATSLANELGVYDGLSRVMQQTVTWGLPYLIGRLYFTDWTSVRELAVGIFVGGLIYVPLCLFEVRMSPQLHVIVYGFHQHVFSQTWRFDGWRPTVFMEHGLMVGMWMTAASLVGVWLWRTRALTLIRGWPVAWVVPVLLITAVLCKSLGALVLLVAGLGTLWVARWLRSPWPVVVLALFPVGYVAARTVGGWTPDVLVSLASVVDEKRAASLQTRIKHETMIADKALRRPTLGWGGWGRGFVRDRETGRDISVPDGLWVIALSTHGVVGLVAVAAVLILPALWLLWRYPTGMWADPIAAGPTVLAVLLILYAIDSLYNAMINPVFMLTAGAVSSLACSFERAGWSAWARYRESERRWGTAAPALPPSVRSRSVRIPVDRGQ